MRILHFSDPHLYLAVGEIPLRHWFSKRAIGALNLLGGRGQRFERSAEKLALLAEFSRQQEVDLVICTGDYTAVGLETEFSTARKAVEALMQRPAGYITVPGNHDLYVQDVLKRQRFIRHFSDVLSTDMPEYVVDNPWPLVRLIGNDLAVIAVNSAKPNLVPWHSNGRIPDSQLAALDKLLDDERLDGRFILLITHYALRLPNGEPDTRLHGLINGDDYLAVCRKIKQGALLCGHVHHRYRVALDNTQTELFCAGSATMEGRESFWMFDLKDGELQAHPGYWDGDRYQVKPR